MSSDPPSGAWGKVAPSGITIGGRVTRDTVPVVYAQIDQTLPSAALPLDLSGVTELDSAGVALILELIEKTGTSIDADRLFGLDEPLRNMFLALLPSDPEEPEPSPLSSTIPMPVRWLERVGSKAEASFAALLDGLILTSNIFYFSGCALLRRGRSRKGTFTTVSVSMGVDALPVVSLIAFLIGLVMALQAAAQLRRFGASIYVADLIGISMTREMGALMTAIVLAGRSGSAIAAEVATMVVTEETDALRSLGLDPTRFVVVPRFLALTLVTPLLALVATAVGIFGGFVAAIGYLDLAPQAFLVELVAAVEPIDVGTSMGKSVVFAWVIAILGSYQGFRVRGGAEGVGRATTAAVVSSIFAVIVVDAVAGMLLYFE